MTAKSKIPFFFIIGRPRSGTTLLRTIFDAHPNVCIPFECPMIINLYLKYKHVDTWSEKIKLDFYEALFNQWKFDSFRVDKDKLKKDILNLPENLRLEDLIRTVYSNFQSVYEKENIQIFGDKNPEYSLNAFYVSRLIKIFPEAKFIHLVRDYRDNFTSYLNVDFEAPIAPLIALRWKKSINTLVKFQKSHPEKFCLLKFEDLIINPESELRKLCKFLNLEFSPLMLDYRRKKNEFLEAFPKEILEKYHLSTMGDLDKNKINSWQKKLTESQIKKLDFVAGRTAEKLGYKKKYIKASFRTILMSLPWIFYGRFWYLIKLTVDHLPFKIRTRIIAQGPILAYVYNKLKRK